MKRFILFFSGLLILSACSHTTSHTSDQAPAGLTVQTLTAGDSGFLVNSHLITGKTDAILVDAQLTRSEAQRVVDMVKASGKTLTTVFITHPHPDHYFGVAVIKAQFPKVKVFAHPSVAADIKAAVKGQFSFWKGTYKENLLDEKELESVIPEAYNSQEIALENHAIRIINVNDGESVHATALYLPESKSLISGDLIYNKVHLWLAENRPDGWLKNLELMKQIGPVETVYSGHGAVGDASLFATNAAYIKDFVQATKRGRKKEKAITDMTKKYPDYALPIILQLSVGARLKK